MKIRHSASFAAQCSQVIVVKVMVIKMVYEILVNVFPDMPFLYPNT